MKHIRGFDVLRSFAVLGVMFYHLGWAPFSYGWLGVPFFFVLSGFLITGILLDNRESGTASYFITFYTRRCLRIFPLYYLYIAVVALWCAWFGAKYEGWSYFIFYLQNYFLGANNLALPPGMALGHTWSLAVEEQFYMLWPLVVFFVSKQQLKALAIILIAVSVISRYWIAHNISYVSFAPLTSNFDTLCLGSLLALAYRESEEKLINLSYSVLFAGVAVTVLAYFLPGASMNGSDSAFMLGLALFFAGIIGLTAAGRLPVPEWKTLSYIGRISYGLYIWHAFTYMAISAALYNHWMPDYGAPVMDGIRLLLTFAIAAASFHLFELPILKLKDRFTYRASQKADAKLCAN
jgi:peptidoglycan/LPS O-acetylase OafA/YrhL